MLCLVKSATHRVAWTKWSLPDLGFCSSSPPIQVYVLLDCSVQRTFSQIKVQEVFLSTSPHLYPWWASLVAQMVKNPPPMQETWVQSLGQEDPLEKGRTTHSSILAWRIPKTEEPGELQSMRLQRVRHNWVTKLASRDPRTDFMASECHAGGFPGGPVVKNLPANAGDMGLTPGPGRFHMLWGN